MSKMTTEQKKQLLTSLHLQEAVYDTTTIREAMTDKELAILKSLCDSNVFGLKYLCNDIDNINTFNTSYDCILAKSGNAKDGNLFSIWSRNKFEKHVKHDKNKNVIEDSRDYGVRVHITLLNKLIADNTFAEAIYNAFAEVHNEKQGVEIRFSKFATLTDCLQFITRLQDAKDNVVAEAEATEVHDVLMIEDKAEAKTEAEADNKKQKQTKSRSKKQTTKRSKKQEAV